MDAAAAGHQNEKSWPFLSARQYARAYTVYSGLVVWSGLVTVPKFLPLVPLFTVSVAGLDSVFPFKDYIL